MSDERKSLSEIAEGDRVWVGGFKEGRARLLTVEKLTKTQIVLSNSYRYKRETFFLIGGGTSYTRITDVATPEECTEYDARIAEAKRQSEARQAEQERLAALRRELHGLFDQKVRIGENTEHEGAEWEVTFYLSTDGVRRLAELIKDESL